MNRTMQVGMLAAGLIGAGVAGAKPPQGASPPLGHNARAGAGGSPAVIDANWSENFDAYANGSVLSGQGGWAPWCTGGSDGLVTSAVAASAPNSFRANALTDMVRTFSGVNSGKWELRIKTYIAAGSAGDGYIVALNNYCAAVNPDWSITVRFSTALGQVGTWSGGAYTNFVPLVTNQWVEYLAKIDFAADTLTEFYNGQQFGPTTTWTGNVGPGGMLQFAALDLYSESLNGMHYDDCSLTQVGGCYPDCDGSGTLTIADFGCFQTKFVQNDPYADCDGSGTLTIADFGCFQTKFVQGCP